MAAGGGACVSVLRKQGRREGSAWLLALVNINESALMAHNTTDISCVEREGP